MMTRPAPAHRGTGWPAEFSRFAFVAYPVQQERGA